MPSLRWLISNQAAIIVSLVALALVAKADDVTVSEFSIKTTGTLKSWNDDKVVIETESKKSTTISNVRSLSFAERPAKTNANAAIWLSSGDRIIARTVVIADDVLTVDWPLMGTEAPQKIGLDKIAAVIFEWPPTKSDRLRMYADLQTAPSGNDIVMLTNGDRSQGEFEKVDSTFLFLKVGKASLKLDRGRVRAIRFNPELTNRPKSTGRRAVMRLADGSQLTASHIELSDNTLLAVHSPELGDLKVPLKSVSTCEFFGGSIVPLSDYQPSKVEFTPYFSATWPLVRNANVVHGPLTIRGTEYVTGLGMHSRMSVTYDLTGNEREFSSLIGIDDTANGAGSVTFTVDVDGKRVWTSPEITGKSPVAVVPEISLRGNKQLTLTVDFGQFADVSDYADWCDAVVRVERAP